jgi:DNA-binding transcriptional ArsR family regulator
MHDIDLLWNHLFDGLRGYLCLAYRTPTGFLHEYYTWPDEREAAARRASELGEQHDTFFSVRLFDEPRRKKDVPGPVQALWCDLDSPIDPVDWPDDVPWPTAIVESGRGWHCYWRLDAVIAPDEAERLVRALVERLGADAAACDSARLLRPPGTLNHKYDPPRPVMLREVVDERQPVATFRQLVATTGPGYGGPTGNGRQVEPLDVGRVLEGVPLGQRNQMLFRLACRLRAAGVPVEWATRLVTEAAANCSPAWGSGPDEEPAERLVQRVYSRYQANPELVVGVSARKFDSPIYKSYVGESNLTGSSGEQFDSPIIEKTVGESNLPFRTPDQLLAYTPSDTPWLWRGFLVKQTVTLLAGRPKVGKSTLTFALLAALERGEPFLGQATVPTKAVVLTEERAATLAAKLRKYPLTSCEFLLRDECRLPWPLVVEAAVQRAKETGAELLVVDTVAAWAQLAADEENQAGAVLAAMAPVLRAASEGLSVLVIAHERKAGAADPVTAVRGSSALTGVVDIVVEVTTGPANLPASARVIRAVGRFDETPSELVIDDGYQVLGSMTEATAAYERERILQCLASDDGMTADEVAEALDLPRATALRRLKELHEAGQVVRSGQGRKGDPYVWCLAKGEYSLSAESYSPVADSIRPRDSLIWANRIPGEPESSERDPARQGCLLETEPRSPTADSIRPRNTYRWANGIGDGFEPNGRHPPGDSSQLVEQGAPDDIIAWGEQLLAELRAGRVQLPVIELKPGHTVLVPERFLASHMVEAKLGIGAALEHLRLYRKALEQFGIGTGSG